MNITHTIIFTGLLGLLACSPLRSSAPPTHEATGPYLWIPAGEEGVDLIPLRSTRVECSLAGLFARVWVIQEYQNQGTRPIEAIYVFPGSTTAAVHGMRLTVGERITEAVLQERLQAQQTYATAKASGQTASLLQEERPNVFSMNVANILPGDQVLVELEYSEMIVPEEGRHVFVYPGVVGPRYVSPEQPSGGGWTGNPYLSEGEPEVATFSLTVALQCPVPVNDLRCRSHPVEILFQDEHSATVHLRESADNRDFILEYRLGGDALASGLLTASCEGEDFFLLMVQPPQRIASEMVLPREYLFVVDVSGSMRGFPLELAKHAFAQLAQDLHPADSLNVLLFAGGSSVLSPQSLPATAEHVKKAVEFVSQADGGGGTELLPALQQAYDLPKAEAKVARSIIVVTDGYIEVEAEAMRLVRSHLGEASLYALGIGSSVNRHLLEGLARAGEGEPFVITSAEEGVEVARRLWQCLRHPVLTRIELQHQGIELTEVEGALSDVLAERPLVFFGKYQTTGGHGQMRLSGLAADGQRFEQTMSFAAAPSLSDPLLLRHLWARRHLRTLDDEEAFQGESRRSRIIAHSLRYGLLSRHTSFVAVDPEIRHPGGSPTSVKQPLPLPQGVTNSAVSIPQTPEPATWALLAMVAAFVAVVCRKSLRR